MYPYLAIEKVGGMFNKSALTGVYCSSGEDSKIFVSLLSPSQIMCLEEGQWVTVAGSGRKGYEQGNGELAVFFFPGRLFYDKRRSLMLVTEFQNDCIRAIDSENNVSLWSKGSLKNPWGLFVDDRTGIVYVVDRGNHCVKSFDLDGNCRLIAGNPGLPGYKDGNGTDALFNSPLDICMDYRTGNLIVSDAMNCRIRSIDTEGNVSTFAGTGNAGNDDGECLSSSFNMPSGVCVDPISGDIFVCCYKGSSLRRINTKGEVSTLFGEEELDTPSGIFFDNDTGVIYVSDRGNGYVKRITGHRSLEHLYLPFKFSDLVTDTDTMDEIILKDGISYIHKIILRCGIDNIDYSEFSNLSAASFSLLKNYLYFDTIEKSIFNDQSLLELIPLIKKYSMINFKHHIFKYLRNNELLVPDEIIDPVLEKFLHQLESYEESGNEEVTNFIGNLSQCTDIVISVTDCFGSQLDFPCHRAIISNKSEYFKCYFQFDQNKEHYNHTSLLSMDTFTYLFNSWYNSNPMISSNSTLLDAVFLLTWGNMYLSENFDLLSQYLQYILEIASPTEMDELLTHINETFPQEMLQDIYDSEIFPKDSFHEHN